MNTQIPQEGPVLALDASGLRTSAALLLPGMAPLEREAPLGERAGTALHGLIQGLLEEAGLGAGQLAAVAAVRGPGSFTGLRVALAAAQGLCLPARIPGLGVETTAALAWATGCRGRVRVLLEGGQGRLFSGCYLREGEGLESLEPIQDLSPEAVLSLLGGSPGEVCFLRGEPDRLDELRQAGARPWRAALSGAAAELAALGLASSQLEPLYARAPAIRPRQA